MLTMLTMLKTTLADSAGGPSVDATFSSALACSTAGEEPQLRRLSAGEEVEWPRSGGGFSIVGGDEGVQPSLEGLTTGSLPSVAASQWPIDPGSDNRRPGGLALLVPGSDNRRPDRLTAGLLRLDGLFCGDSASAASASGAPDDADDSDDADIARCRSKSCRCAGWPSSSTGGSSARQRVRWYSRQRKYSVSSGQRRRCDRVSVEGLLEQRGLKGCRPRLLLARDQLLELTRLRPRERPRALHLVAPCGPLICGRSCSRFSHGVVVLQAVQHGGVCGALPPEGRGTRAGRCGLLISQPGRGLQ
eukprot:scaffold49386_cov60-Phaeocystis_antarctica.AAC.3